MASAPTPSASPPAEPAKDDAGYSGRLLLRMPPELHGELARAAQREGTSLNGYINGVLSASREPQPDPGSQPDPGLERGRRLIRAAVFADLVLVAVAAAVAIAMLLVAWP